MPTKAQVKFVQSLSQKKVRDERGLFIAEGPKVVEEFLHAPNIQAQEVFATAEWLAHHGQIVEAGGGVATEIDGHALKQMSSLSTPNQVVGIFSKPVFDEAPHFEGQLSLMLDGIQDPGNMGTIIRCADWFKVPHIICSLSCADAFGPKVVQSTMGSLGRVQVLYKNLLSFAEPHQHVPIYAAALDGENLFELPPITEGFLLIGNESQGISDPMLEMAKHRVTIPRYGEAESLNAGVAAGILLSHLRRI